MIVVAIVIFLPLIDPPPELAALNEELDALGRRVLDAPVEQRAELLDALLTRMREGTAGITAPGDRGAS